MSLISKLEPLTGTVDGTNRDFTASTSFVSGSEVVFLRGLPRVRTNDDGWVVLNAALGQIRLNEAPLPGDMVEMLWAYDAGVTPETEVSPIVCFITDVSSVLTGIQSMQPVAGCLPSEQITAAVAPVQIRGAISDIQAFSCQIEGCNG
jgi:hypothetical protein